MKQWIKILGLILLLGLLLVACAPADDPGDNGLNDDGNINNDVNLNDEENFDEQGAQGARYEDNRNVDRFGGQWDEAPQTEHRGQNSQEIAERLADLATEVEGVNGATSVVVGRWAVVGIDVNADLDQDRVGNIKYSVAEALKADPFGAYAAVTADPDITQRLQEMNEEIQAGQPVEGVMEELAGIVGRLMPQVPRNVQDPEGEADQEMDRDPEERMDVNND